MADPEKNEQDKKSKDQKVLAWRQKIEGEYNYCMISTLNQMVNYLPMLLFDFKLPKMYVTLKDSELNTTFDWNLKETCRNLDGSYQSNRFVMPEEKEDITIGDINDVSNIQATLSQKCKGKKVLWNITGGQRPFVMAIFELLKAEERKSDLVIYLEGNSGKPTFLEVVGDKLKKVEPDTHGFDRYKIDHDKWLTIPTALQLMGIEIHDDNSSFSLYPVLDSITAKYEKKENDTFRKRLLSLNKRFTSKTKGLKQRAKPETLEGKKLYFIEEVYNDGTDKQTKPVRFYNGQIWNCPDAQKRRYLLKDQDEEYLNQEEYDFLTKSYEKRSFPFGHMLEDMFAQKLWKLLNGSIADMAVNLKLFSPKESINEQIDEIDIAILTKTGQLLVFEVKSGDMSGDVAKSTKYTTYAIAGVYGKPVLLTALLKNQFKEEIDLTKDWAYGSSAAAILAARRAQLPIIALDGNDSGDFNAAIKKLLHL